MSVDRRELLADLQTDFEAMLNLVTGPEVQTATLNPMEGATFVEGDNSGGVCRADRMVEWPVVVTRRDEPKRCH